MLLKFDFYFLSSTFNIHIVQDVWLSPFPMLASFWCYFICPNLASSESQRVCSLWSYKKSKLTGQETGAEFWLPILRSISNPHGGKYVLWNVTFCRHDSVSPVTGNQLIAWPLSMVVQITIWQWERCRYITFTFIYCLFSYNLQDLLQTHICITDIILYIRTLCHRHRS